MVRREAHREAVGLRGLYGERYNPAPGVKTVCEGPLAIDAASLEVKLALSKCR